MAQSLTVTFSGLTNRLITNVGIAESLQQLSSQTRVPDLRYSALWDTGATMTAITERVAQECGLPVVGAVDMSTASGTSVVPVYHASLWLPNRVCVTELKVAQVVLASGIDVLIGMDVIIQGDFAITNKNKRTLFSFRYPSSDQIDYTLPVELQPKAPTVARNAKCPCGSGKKYKACHGKPLSPDALPQSLSLSSATPVTGPPAPRPPAAHEQNARRLE